VPNQLAGYILDLGKNRNKNAASDDTQTHTDGSTCIRVRFVVNLVRNESFRNPCASTADFFCFPVFFVVFLRFALFLLLARH